MISIAKVLKGHNSIKAVGGVMTCSLHIVRRYLISVPNFIKISRRIIESLSNHYFFTKFTKGHNSIHESK